MKNTIFFIIALILVTVEISFAETEISTEQAEKLYSEAVDIRERWGGIPNPDSYYTQVEEPARYSKGLTDVLEIRHRRQNLRREAERFWEIVHDLREGGFADHSEAARINATPWMVRQAREDAEVFAARELIRQAAELKSRIEAAKIRELDRQSQMALTKAQRLEHVKMAAANVAAENEQTKMWTFSDHQRATVENRELLLESGSRDATQIRNGLLLRPESPELMAKITQVPDRLRQFVSFDRSRSDINYWKSPAWADGFYFHPVLAPVELFHARVRVNEFAPMALAKETQSFTDLYLFDSTDSMHKRMNVSSSLFADQLNLTSRVQFDKAVHFHTWVAPLYYVLQGLEGGILRNAGKISDINKEFSEKVAALMIEKGFANDLKEARKVWANQLNREAHYNNEGYTPEEIFRKQLSSNPEEVGLLMISEDRIRRKMKSTRGFEVSVAQAEATLGPVATQFVRRLGYAVFSATYELKSQYPMAWYPGGYAAINRQAADLSASQKWLLAWTELSEKGVGGLNQEKLFKSMIRTKEVSEVQSHTLKGSLGRANMCQSFYLK